eukprot:TRINITY_DN19362_c0_g1_i1.p1 TRINITY_DN19362_c0_g1~~TRINITY_DN19362_c0_g1_i1.p1  ORF type:complete len:527 (+),score=127.10 TRINITY_DN19362_c0_g1_i1:57-1637(+)
MGCCASDSAKSAGGEPPVKPKEVGQQRKIDTNHANNNNGNEEEHDANNKREEDSEEKKRETKKRKVALEPLVPVKEDQTSISTKPRSPVGVTTPVGSVGSPQSPGSPDRSIRRTAGDPNTLQVYQTPPHYRRTNSNQDHVADSVAKENSVETIESSRSPSPPHYAHASPMTTSSFNNGSFGNNNMLHASPSVYGLPLNMSLTLMRSPPEGSASRAPPDSTAIVKQVRKCATMQPRNSSGDTSSGLARGQSLTLFKAESTGSLRRDGSLPFIQGVPLAHSESNLATYVKERDRDDLEMSRDLNNPLGLSGIDIRSPIDATRVETPDDDALDSNFLSPSPKPRKQMSFTMDYLANTQGGHQYGIKISCCDPEPTKNKELNLLQGHWEDSAENKWHVEDRTAKVIIRSTGVCEKHMLEDAPQQASGMVTLGRITLMGSLVARHEWSQIIWTDGDVWQQVWGPGDDVDVYYGEDEGWYGGKVKVRSEEGKYSIQFDDGEVAENVEGGHMRKREKDLVETVHLLPPINPHI